MYQEFEGVGNGDLLFGEYRISALQDGKNSGDR